MEIELNTYTPGELSDKLKIQPGTLRKYSQLLEAKGVIFQRDAQDHRIYYENDYQNFYYLCDLRKRGTALSKAIGTVAELYLQNLTSLSTDTKTQSADLTNELIEVMKQENSQLRNEIKQTNELLFQVLQELQTTRQEIAAIKENQLQAPILNMLPMPEETFSNETDQQPKKKWWQRLLN